MHSVCMFVYYLVLSSYNITSSIYSYNICYVFIVTEHRRRKYQPSSLSPSASSEEDGGSGGYNDSDDEKISQQDGVDVLVSSLPASSQPRLVAQSTHTPHSLRSLPRKRKKKKERESTDHSTHPTKSQVSRDF